MKKYFAIISLLCFLTAFTVSCMDSGTDDSSSVTTANQTSEVGLKPVPEVAVPSVSDKPEIGEDPAPVPDKAEPRVEILTEPYFDGYEIGDRLNYDAFLKYLKSYFAELMGEDVLVVITDIIDGEGVVTLLTEYHDIKAFEAGRRTSTIRGGGNLFFNYSTESGADFSEQLFAGVELLHNFYKSEVFVDGDYIFVDNDGYVCIHESDGRIIKTPALYSWGCNDMADVIQWRCDDNHMQGKPREHYIVAVYRKSVTDKDVTDRIMNVYATKDGGVTWSESELDYTPVTTEHLYPVDDIALRPLYSGELDTCSIILSTNRCEVFYYLTEDGGVTWERCSNFKLLNYRYEAFIDGGIIFDDLAIMAFEARDGKNPNVYISRDGGYNWSLMDIPTPDGLSDEGAYACALYKWNGVAVIEVMYGDAMRRYVSFDHGATWEWE